MLGGIGATGVASLAGCLDVLPIRDEFDYRKWMYRDRSAREKYEYVGSFHVTRPKAILEHEAHLGSNFVELFEGGGEREEISGIAFPNVEYAFWYNSQSSMNVWSGGFTREDVERELRANGFEEVRDHRGYTIFLTWDEEADHYGWAVAVSDDTVLIRLYHSLDPAKEADTLAFMIDTRKGVEDRYVDEVDAADRLTRELDAGHHHRGWIFHEGRRDTDAPEDGRFPGLTGRGRSLRIQGARTQVRGVFVFDDRDAAAEADVGTWAATRGDSAYWRHADEIDTSVDGETVVATAEIDSDELWTA